MDIKEIARKLRDKLNQYDDFVGLYLYGSRVYGDPKPDSDIDIVAIFGNNPDYKKRKSVQREALELEFEHDVFIDLHPMTEDELNLNYFYYDEIKKGIYYAAG